MTVTFIYGGRKIPATGADGRTVLELAQQAGIPLESRCGGRGVCEACLVLLAAGEYRIYGETLTVPADHHREALACQTRIRSPHATVIIPAASLVVAGEAQIVDDFALAAGRLRPAGDAGWTLAVDIGTTTVVAALVDRAQGRIAARAARFNQQILRADDVAARISLCEDPEQVGHLQALVVRHTLNPMLAELCRRANIAPADIRDAVISGNTVMSHLFLGLSPLSIGRLPFTPVFRRYPETTAGALKLDLPAAAPVRVFPSVSGYVGGDIVADMIVAGMEERSGTNLLLDIGTNGEMVLQHKGQMLACATAAGPAFEGAGLWHGCRAVRGAIEAVSFNEHLDFELGVIGNNRPIGICGSGIVDFLAAGLRCGLINAYGRLDIDLLRRHGRYRAVKDRGALLHACVLADEKESGIGEAVFITEKDIAEVLKAKAAVQAGTLTLLREAGCAPADLDRLILAGGFAKHLRLENATAIGLLPELPPERFEVIGNGALAGACLAALDPAVLKAGEDLIDRPRVVELNLTRDFEDFFQRSLALPFWEE